MRKKCFINIVASVLIVSTLVFTAGCSRKAVSSNDIQAQDLMKGIKANKVEGVEDITKDSVYISDFAVQLFKASMEDGQNTLLSPFSVLCALAMTANGAEGETLAQMEKVLGMPCDELNSYLYSYMASLPQNDKYKLSIADSIWFTDNECFTVNHDFLQTNADYYNADIYRAPFDRTTRDDINSWVKEKTDGMIPEIIEEIPSDAVMYLVNALAFEAEWESIYENAQVREGVFTGEDGTTHNVEFMYSNENTYLEDENSVGFIKYYKDRKYAFVALLPNENMGMADYVSSLTGEHLNELISNGQSTLVRTSIPKFETEYSTEMSAVLAEMGMPDAFNGSAADFTGLGTSSEGNIYIGRILHKTFISVGEKGTKAGAATVVEMSGEGAPAPIDEKEVYLNRPFVYMLIDCEANIPLFIGTMMNTGE